MRKPYKTDLTDAHSAALVATRMAGLRPVDGDEQLAVLRLLADRRRLLGENHTRMISQLHRLLLELIPGGRLRRIATGSRKAINAPLRSPRARRSASCAGRLGISLVASR